MNQQRRNSTVSLLLLGLIILFCLSWLWRMDSRSASLTYSQVRQLFEQEKVETVSFADEHTLVLGLHEEEADLGNVDTVRYQLYDVALFYEDLNDLILEQKARGIITTYDYPKPPTTNWLELLLPYVLVAVALGLLWYFMIARSQGGGIGPDKMAKFGTARTRTLTDHDKKVTLARWPGRTRRRKNSRRLWSF